MQIKLRIAKDGKLLYAGLYEIVDANSFGKACADAWSKLRQAQLDQETSIGALLEHLDGDVLELLNGAHLSLEKA